MTDFSRGDARTVFARLAQAGVGCVVYKNCAAVDAGLAGNGDIDLLVTSGDMAGMQASLSEAGGIRGFVHPLYDNAIPEREDWFVPLEDARMLHLDVAHAVMAGPKFRKRHRVAELGELELEETDTPGLQRVTPEQEAEIALLRAAFQFGPLPLNRRARAGKTLSEVIDSAYPVEAQEHDFQIDIGKWAIACPVRRAGSRFLLDSKSLHDIRSAIRHQNGVGGFAAVSDWAIHFTRRARFTALRRITRRAPGRAVAKRRFAEGRIIALVGPDGVGKSTQTARMSSIFARKFRCTSVYLGSNDGSWMKLRGKLGLVRSSGSDNSKSFSTAKPSTKRDRGQFHALGSAIWRYAVAANRLLAIRRAMRLGKAGALVITDRWPQMIAPGILDGPSVQPAKQHHAARLIWRAEQRLYRAMESYAPDHTIHLDCDFATSYERKPGDIERDDFERRIVLMQEMRVRNGDIEVVDARQDMDAVTAQLFAAIWKQLSPKLVPVPLSPG